MNHKLKQRIYNYAIKNRSRLVWRRRLHALLYSADLIALSKIKEINKHET